MVNLFLKLARQLYPTGNAFKMPTSGWHEALHKALSISAQKVSEDAASILDSILPDNDRFTEEDATAWERRLGLISNNKIPLEDRKKAIARKLNFPGRQKARQNFRYLQDQLNKAGFTVTVYENRFPDGSGGYITKKPEEFSGDTSFLAKVRHGQIRTGQRKHGSFIYNNKIVNHIDESLDLYFNTGDNLKSTFFIGGSVPGTYADVLSSRHDEFRELILKIKPVQTVGFLFINYV